MYFDFRLEAEFQKANMEQMMLSSVDSNIYKNIYSIHSEYKKLRVLVYLQLLNLNGQSVLKREFHHCEEGSMMFICKP